MVDKIKVEIFGDKDKVETQGCPMKGNGCSGCSGGCGGSCSGCGSSKNNGTDRTLKERCEEVFNYVRSSDVGDNVDLVFYDINNINVLDYDDIRVLLERGFEPPFTVIDGIVRYYGGISTQLIYKDIKELFDSNK